MLNRTQEISSPEKIISDNLTHKPSVGQSVWNNFSLGLATPTYAIKSFDDQFNQSPEGQSAHAAFESLKRGNENSEVGWAQWGANEVSNMLGQGLNPLTIMMGEAGGLAIKPITSLASKLIPATSFLKQPLSKILGEKAGKYLPETVGTELEEKNLSLALLGSDITKGFGVGAGATLPQATIDNFNAETGKHDILGMAKGMGEGGVFGMAIGTIPFAWGVLKHNIFKKTGIDITPHEGEAPPSAEELPPAGTPPVAPTEEAKPVKMTTAEARISEATKEVRAEEPTLSPQTLKIAADLQQAVTDGKLSQDTFNFWKEMHDYKTNPDIRVESKPEVQSKATQYLTENGHEVDHANDMALVEVLDRDQINSLQSATVDQLVADHVPEDKRTALTDFTVQAAVDEMRNKPEMIEGLRGYVDYATNNLEHKDDIIDHMDHLIDVSVKQNSGVESIPLDQKSLYEIALKYRTTNQLPFYIPENIKNLIKQNDRDFLKYLKQLADEQPFKRLDVNDNLTSHDFYHGTGAISDITQFNINRTDETSLFGSGLYLTDNKLIAMGYAGSRQKSLNPAHQGKILELKFKEKPKLVDLEDKPNTEVLDIINEEMSKHTTTHLLAENADKPIEKIFETYKHDLAEELSEDADAFSIYYNSINNINAALEKAGYDGYLHTGGLRVGKGKKHNVVIVFGHDYVSDGVHHLKSPANKLTQETLDLAGDFKSKIHTFKKVELSTIDKERLERLETENKALLKKFEESGSAKYIREVRVNNDKIKYIKSKVEKLKSPIEELNDIKNSLIEDRENPQHEVVPDTREQNQAAIKKLTDENDRLFKKYEETGSHEHIDEMKANHKKIVELEGTRKTVRKDYARTNAYKRLQDLAEIWEPAKILLDRIKLEENIKKQEAYRDLGKTLLDIADNNTGKQADVGNVKAYLEERTKQRIDEPEAPSMAEVKESHKVPADAEAIIAEQDQAIEKVSHDHAKEEYNQAKEKLEEFKGREGVFKSLIKCVLGAKG